MRCLVTGTLFKEWTMDTICYSAFMRSDFWAEQRQRIRLRDRQCQDCGEPGQEVHHLYLHEGASGAYEQGRFEEVTDDELVFLCIPCHDVRTNRARSMRYAKKVIPILDYESRTFHADPSVFEPTYDAGLRAATCVENSSAAHARPTAANFKSPYSRS